MSLSSSTALEPTSCPRNGRRLLFLPLRIVSGTSTCVPYDPTVVLILSETEELSLSHMKFLKQFFCPPGACLDSSPGLPICTYSHCCQVEILHAQCCAAMCSGHSHTESPALSSFLHRGELQVMDMPEKEPRYDLF